MPEGDTLHRLANRLGPVLIGQEVLRCELSRSPEVTLPKGTRIIKVSALGKNLLIEFEVPKTTASQDSTMSFEHYTLRVHLKMNGRVIVVAEDSPAAPPMRRNHDTRAWIQVTGYSVFVIAAPVVEFFLRGSVRGRDFGRDLGPDILGEHWDLDLAAKNLISAPSVELGVALMDQWRIAGIGNVWKSELLFHHRLNPFAPNTQLSFDAAAGIVTFGRSAMQANVSMRGRLFETEFSRVSDPSKRGPRLWVYERRGEPCFECGGAILMKRQGFARRSTYFCPVCQRPTIGSARTTT